MKLEKSLIYLRTTAMVVFSILLQDEASAQRFSAGLLAGFNASQIDGDMLAGFDKVGLTAGITTTINLKSALSANLDFLYSERGSRPDIFNPDYDPDINISLKYIELPVYISIGDWWQEEGEYHKVSAYGGLSYGRLLDAQTTDYYHSSEESYDLLVPYFSKNDLSWLVGATFKMSRQWGVTFRYSRGIIPLLDPEKNNLNTSRLLSYWLTFRFEYYFK